jgi:lactoylglutathione lyase
MNTRIARTRGEAMTFTSIMPNLYAADIERTVAFYRDLLGSTQTFRYPAQGPAEHVELRLGDVTLALSSRDAVHGQGLPAPAPGNPLELVVWCDSADAAVAALRDAGTPVLVEPYDHVAGHRRAYVADPDGTWVVLVSKQ